MREYIARRVIYSLITIFAVATILVLPPVRADLHFGSRAAVRAARGTKNVILRNVVRAKFDRIVKPVAKKIFAKKLQKDLSFRAYFDHILAWQLAHAIVPRDLEEPGGTKATARYKLRGRYPYVEALQGEAVALLNYLYLVDREVFKGGSAQSLAVTYLASLFDAVRLAKESPQTMARATVYNYLAREWVFRYDSRSRTFEVNAPAMRDAVRKLAAEALAVMGRGDYHGAGRLIVQHGIMPPEMRQKLAELDGLPVEILPSYTSMR